MINVDKKILTLLNRSYRSAVETQTKIQSIMDNPQGTDGKYSAEQEETLKELTTRVNILWTSVQENLKTTSSQFNDSVKASQVYKKFSASDEEKAEKLKELIAAKTVPPDVLANALNHSIKSVDKEKSDFYDLMISYIKDHQKQDQKKE